MPSSKRLRTDDVRAIFQILGECRDLGDDPVVWRKHLFGRLGSLVGAGLGLGGELAGCRSGQLIELGSAEWGWENGFNREAWLKALANLRDDPSYSTMINHYLPHLQATDGVSLTRVDCLPDQVWYPCAEYQGIYRLGGFDHTVWCFHSLAGQARDEFNTILFFRPEGDRNFSARDRE